MGFRILVDRLWPRGISKERAALDVWAKEVAPSPELRKWFNHKPERFKEFSARYTEELEHNSEVQKLKEQAKTHGSVLLLYGAKDPRVNHAVVLQEYLQQHFKH